MITVPGGYPTRRDPAIADPITSPAEGAAEVDKLVGKGAALLEDGGNNTLPMLSVAEVQAIVAEAHKLHRIVTAHVLEGPGLAIALALQVMQAATAKAGVELGMSPLGILRQNAPADLWAVRGDPTQSLHLLGKPIYVMARGDRVR